MTQQFYSSLYIRKKNKNTNSKRYVHGDFPGGPVVRTAHFHCRGYGFDPWLGNSDPTNCTARPKKKEREDMGTQCS